MDTVGDNWIDLGKITGKSPEKLERKEQKKELTEKIDEKLTRNKRKCVEEKTQLIKAAITNNANTKKVCKF